MKKLKKIQTGFSLIEMAVVIVLLAILVGFSFQFLTGGVNAYITGRNYVDVSQQGKIALERMAREARFALQTTISTATNSISFTKFTGSPEDSGTGITFHLVPGTDIIRRTSNGPTPVADLAWNVQSFSPSYANETYYLITLDLTLTRGEGSVRYRTAVCPRN